MQTKIKLLHPFTLLGASRRRCLLSVIAALLQACSGEGPHPPPSDIEELPSRQRSFSTKSVSSTHSESSTLGNDENEAITTADVNYVDGLMSARIPLAALKFEKLEGRFALTGGELAIGAWIIEMALIPMSPGTGVYAIWAFRATGPGGEVIMGTAAQIAARIGQGVTAAEILAAGHAAEVTAAAQAAAAGSAGGAAGTAGTVLGVSTTGAAIIAVSALVIAAELVVIFYPPAAEQVAITTGMVESPNWSTPGSNDSQGIHAGRSCVEGSSSLFFASRRLAQCLSCCNDQVFNICTEAISPTTSLSLSEQCSYSPNEACRAVCNVAYQ